MSELEPWRANLIVTGAGAPKPLLANAITALREAPAWQGVLAYDQFALEAIVSDAPPWHMGLQWATRAWSSHDDLLAAEWLQRNGISVNAATAAQAVEAVARERSYHPVIDYLSDLQHDGVSRTGTWLSTCLGTEQAVARERSYHPVIDYLSDLQHDGVSRTGTWLSTCLGTEQSRYGESVGRAMLIAAVARIYDPGCKVDTVPIFEGAQGARKSTAVRALFDPWFSDELADLGSKDAAMQTRGVWGIEVSELDAMSRMEVSRIKSFITRTTDRFRPPYGSRIIESPRSCVFWGTTNSDSYLKDETGGRRFWPVKIGKINVDLLRDWRDQLWAEAVTLYQAGIPWWLTKKETQAEAEHHQRDRYIGDPWDKAIAEYVETASEVTMDEVLRFAVKLEIGRCGQSEMNRAARCLRSLGLSRVQV